MREAKLLSVIDDKEWDIAVQRETILKEAAGRKRLDTEYVNAKCNLLHVSSAYFYRMLEKYRKDQRTSALLKKKPGRSKDGRYLDEKVEELIEAAIREHFLSRQKPKLSQLQRIIALEAHKQGLVRPSRKAINRRVKMIDQKIVLKAREGSKAAHDNMVPVPGSFQAIRPLQIVEIDHTKVDVLVVDEVDRKYIQRPWLTLLIDVCTRMVTGFYLTLEAPSLTSVALAIQHSVLPKEEWLEARGISAAWPVSGLPEVLHMDNGKEFHAKALRRGAEEYGIKLFYRPVATPHYGGHIERLIGTMMGEVHLLPGTTFSNVAERGDYNSESRACLTLKELEHWLAIEIVGQYHMKAHQSLARPPLAVWKELAAHPDISFRHPQDKKHFFCDFLPFEERKICRDGINLFGIKYWDSVLSLWAGVSDRQFVVRYDPRDLSIVFVLSPEGEYLPVRYRDLSYPSITLRENKMARNSLRECGRHEVDEQVIFDAIEAQRMLLAESASKTKSARREQQRMTEALQAKMPRHQTKVIERQVTVTEENDKPVQPFDIEEWS